mgnify:CR=1 FL=1
MIRRKNDVRVRPVENAQGGEGTVTFYDWLLPEEAAGHGRVFSKLVIPPGASIGYHEHEGEFEAYTVLSGEATVDEMITAQRLFSMRAMLIYARMVGDTARKIILTRIWC